MNYEYLIFIKENLWLINFVIPSFFFIVSILPIFSKDALMSQSKPIIIELMAVFFIIFFMLKFSLNFISTVPLFSENDIICRSKLVKISEFNLVNKEISKLKILRIGSTKYLTVNKKKRIYEIPIRFDYSYQKCK